MALEQTYNKDAKTQLLKGITQQQTIREKYPKALPALTAVSEQTEAVVHVSEGTGTPRRPAKTQASKDRDAVNNIQAIREKYHKALHALTAVLEQTKAVVGTCQ